MKVSGSCLCGAVTYTIDNAPHDTGACHCNMCRKWSGGVYLGVQAAPDQVEVRGEENITHFTSSAWAERGFCKQCGGNLFYHIVDSGDYQMAAGLFDDQSGLRLSLQVFTDKKPAFYGFANETKMMTEAEVFAMFAPPPEGAEG